MRKQSLIKKTLLLMVLLLGAGTAWADTSTLIFTAKCNGSGTADDGAEWTVTSDGDESNFDSTYGIHYGTNNAEVSYLQLTTSDIKGTITQVVVNTRDAQACATISVSVGEIAFLCDNATATNTSTDYTFTGNASGEIIVKIDRGESKKKAIYVKSIVVTYTKEGGTEDHSVDTKTTINANGIKNTNYFNGSDAGKLTAVVVDNENVVINEAAVTWTSSKEEVATIDEEGNVTLVAAGKTTITANYAGVENKYKASQDTYELTVTNDDPSAIILWSEDFSDYNVEKYGLDGTITLYENDNYAGGEAPELLVGKNGGSFQATITLDNIEGNLTLTYKTNNQNLKVSSSTEGVSLSGDTKPKGSKEISTVTISDVTSDMTEIVILFSNNTSSNCRLDDILLIGSKSSSTDKPSPKLSFGENTEFTVLPNAEFTAPTLTFADSFDGTVKYSSSNEEVALVDESTGDVVIGEKEGQAIITAKSEATENFKAGSASYKINVKDNRQELTMSWSESEVNIALGATEADYTLPTLNPADIKVSLESDNEDVAVIVDGKVVVATDAIGKARITAKFAGNDTYKPTTASYTISVYDPNKKGTINNPYTVAEALENTPAEGTSEEVYVKGIVSGFYGENTSITGDSSHRYYISDDGTTDVQLLVYNGKGKDNVAFSNDDDLLIGDEVVIVGKLTTYQETKEFAKDNYIVSLIRIEKIDPALSFGETTEFSVSLGETFTAPSLTFVEGFTGTVTYSSDKKEVAMVDEATGEVVLMGIAGTAKITASFAGSIEYKASSASYTIKVIDPNANDGSLEKPFTVAEVINGTASGSDIYVKGFIVGGYAKAAPIVDLSKLEASNIALADKADEVDGSKTIPVQLLKDTEPRTNFNLVDHAYNIAVAQVLVKANVDTYFSVNGLKGTSEIAKIAEQLTISDAGLATYYTDCALDFTGFDDMYAYTASFKDNGLELTRIKGVVPAETGVLLRNPKGGAVSNLVPVAEDAEAIANNAFIGTLEDITIKKNDDEGNTYYILGKNKDGNIGFYWASEDGTLVASHKAYVKVAGSAGDATRFDLNFNDLVTGIKGVGASESKGTVYDLQGRRVAQPTKGLYIVDGKKVVIK